MPPAALVVEGADTLLSRRIERAERTGGIPAGATGPQSIERQRDPRTHTTAFLDAAVEAGHLVTPPNLPKAGLLADDGLAASRCAGLDRRRLSPHQDRRNLTVVTGAFVRHMTSPTPPRTPSLGPQVSTWRST